MIDNSLEMRGRFERRMHILEGIAVIFLLLVFIRLVDLQWLQHEGLLLQAEHNSINIVPILPIRGEIVDRNGVGLALNHVSYNLTMIPERVDDLPAELKQIQRLMHWPDARMKDMRKRVEQGRGDRPVLLADMLDWNEVAHVAARLHELPGVNVQAGTHRYYPYGALISHLIGYVSLARTDDLQNGALSTEKVGRRGVERAFQNDLRGELGSQYEEVDAKGRRVRVFKHVPSQMGDRVKLSLDIRLQKAASEALGDRTGAVVVMDVHTGGLLVLLSKPGFDPNLFITGLESDQWQEWLKDPQHPLINRAIQSAYPPGSTFKPLVALAGLQDGAPLTHQTTQCPGYFELANRKYRCWKHRGHGAVNLHKAIVQSCDVYFYKLGAQLGMPAISKAAQEWGFGEQTGIGIGPESKGTIPITSGPGARRWFTGQTIITAIGQGGVTVTPIQMARFMAAIANGGELLRPHLLAGEKPEVERKIDVKPQYLDEVRSAMRDVVASIHGTAHRAMGHLPWASAGKTGTAQVISEAHGDKGKIDIKSLLHRNRDHAWYVGYAPYKNPRIAFAVVVEHGGHGGSAAAPVAAAVVSAMAGASDEEVKKIAQPLQDQGEQD